MARLLPMLAVPWQPFDDPEYLFEVKWDGVRALSEVSQDTWHLWGRQGQTYTPRYPELEVLRQLPSGSILDGELVVVKQGRADFPALLSRHHRQQGRRYLSAEPIHYVVFDLLAYGGRSLLREPFAQRRQLLQEILPRDACLMTCAGALGTGRDFFAQVVAEGQEGLVAKRLKSPYAPGQRSQAWRKIKPVQELPCLVIGYQTGPEGVKALLLAAEREGELRYIGTLELGVPTGTDLLRQLQSLARQKPLVPCPYRACWLEPGRICKVRFHGWRPSGGWRDPVFAGWIEP
jgi:bifunctional non-homologous end joining protein LigD